MLQYALLGFLAYGPLTGYELKKRIDDSTSNFWHAKQSQIYTVLKSMEKNGFVSSELELHGNKRRVYDITDEGRDDLKKWLEQMMVNMDTIKLDLLLKLFFSAKINPEIVLMQLKIQKILHLKQLQKYQTETKDIIAEFSALLDSEQDARFWEFTRHFGEMYEEMFLRWIDETIEEIKKIIQPSAE